LPGLAAASDSTVRQAGGVRGQPYLRCKMTEALTATLLELGGGSGGGGGGGAGGGGGGGQQPTVVRPTELLDAVHELMPTFRRHEQQDAQEPRWSQTLSLTLTLTLALALTLALTLTLARALSLSLSLSLT
jgi:hypothetical protein